MKEIFSINCPVGGFEDIKEFDLKEFGDIENPSYTITHEMKAKMANLVGYRLENAERFADSKEYDVAVELTKSSLWLLEILNKRFPYKEQ